MKFIKKYITSIFLCIALAVPSTSHAFLGFGDIVFDPGQTMTSVIEFMRESKSDIKDVYLQGEAQVMRYKDEILQVKAAVDDAEKLARLARQIQRLTDANDLAGLANLLQENSIVLQELDLAKWVGIDWDDFSVQQFMRIIEIMSKGEAIGIYASEVDDMFANKYEGWEAYTQQVYNTGTFYDKYNEWSLVNRDTIKGALKAIGIQAEEITSEEQLMTKLKAKSETAEGNMQILQVSNDLASAQVGQMQKMRQLLMSQTQMQAAYYATIQDEKDLLNAQAQSANMREIEDGFVPIIDDAGWDDATFKLKVD